MGRSKIGGFRFLSTVPLTPEETASLKQFGAAIRRQRTRRSMTQERLAELSDLHLRSIQKIEAGHKNVLVTTAQRIQKSLGCSWDELLS